MCAACVERALQSRDTAPQEARSHFRQALFAAIFGITAWAIFVLGVGLAALGGPERNLPLVVLGALVVLVSPFPAFLGVGPAAAAIRSRGDHMILATMGLILSGLHLGVLVGLFTFAVLFNE